MCTRLWIFSLICLDHFSVTKAPTAVFQGWKTPKNKINIHNTQQGNIFLADAFVLFQCQGRDECREGWSAYICVSLKSFVLTAVNPLPQQNLIRLERATVPTKSKRNVGHSVAHWIDIRADNLLSTFPQILTREPLWRRVWWIIVTIKKKLEHPRYDSTI